MPLDASLSPKSVTATLHYQVRIDRKPERYVTEPPPGVVPFTGIDDPRDVTIEDARGRESEFTIDRNGFQLVHAPSLVRDFYDREHVKSVYYPEVERLLLDTLGASRVVVFDHGTRNASVPGQAKPSRQVHNDHTVNSAPRRVHEHLGAQAPVLLTHRMHA